MVNSVLYYLLLNKSNIHGVKRPTQHRSMRESTSNIHPEK